jgi:plasmid maintenance system antidote protein VapI
MAKKKHKLSDQLRQAIEDAEESRYRIAQDTGLDQAVLSKFVLGQRGVSLDTIDVLGEYLGLSISTDKHRTRKGK